MSSENNRSAPVGATYDRMASELQFAGRMLIARKRDPGASP